MTGIGDIYVYIYENNNTIYKTFEIARENHPLTEKKNHVLKMNNYQVL